MQAPLCVCVRGLMGTHSLVISFFFSPRWLICFRTAMWRTPCQNAIVGLTQGLYLAQLQFGGASIPRRLIISVCLCDRDTTNPQMCRARRTQARVTWRKTLDVKGGWGGGEVGHAQTHTNLHAWLVRHWRMCAMLLRAKLHVQPGPFVLVLVTSPLSAFLLGGQRNLHSVWT